MEGNDHMIDFGPRVLLVEDDPEHAFIAVTVIRQVLGDGCEVVVAETADEALGVIRHFTEQDRPDLMLVDLRLPDKGGFAVLSAARAH
jgi:CheY-like chemotaxis protein